TPAARRIASDNKIDINQISGSGPLGRVQAADVELNLGQPSVRSVAGPGESLELNTMRQRIANRLTASYQDTPHIYLTVEVDMQEAVASRKRLNALYTDETSKNISLTAYLIKAVAWSLKRHPYLNSSLEEETIHLWEEINIGVATALDEGLIVPVIPNADQRSLYEVNATLRDLTKRARLGELNREEVKHGTFTISNLGMYGIQSFTAIINPPQSAILAVGSLTRKPVVVDDNDHIEIHPLMTLTLSVDHRIIDGAVGAMFLSDLVKALETPELLML
ncbi:MAG: 2-oxo acid dehydrogenase subunit E2, partial [Anaerolineaceae bacterium]|nr:2-oxo acid dehydrogenase subunit E2 [Anaerolineaceae bacterium]